jgi:SAM-dependent methyltransferase
MAQLSQHARADAEPSRSQPAPQTTLRPGPSPLPQRPADYLERNRAAWDRWASASALQARRTWNDRELRWGLWDQPESALGLLRGLAPGADVVELGSGAAGISAWALRLGLRPVAVDFSNEQLRVAEKLQREFRIPFPLLCVNAEQVPYDGESFDAAISEYGASLWCNPRRWVPEAFRLLRPDGVLIFFTTSAFVTACTPDDGGKATDLLVRDYFAPYEVTFVGEETVEFHLTHGHWIRLLRSTGFVLENLIEVRPPRDATPRFGFVSPEWARRWPSEEIWIARKPAERQ